MQPSRAFSAMPRSPGLADRVFGVLGQAVISTVLTLARLWAKVTRSSWHGN